MNASLPLMAQRMTCIASDLMTKQAGWITWTIAYMKGWDGRLSDWCPRFGHRQSPIPAKGLSVPKRKSALSDDLPAISEFVDTVCKTYQEVGRSLQTDQ
jgi:hypothetical protein